MTKIIDLTKQLVSIPSWVDDQTNEIKVSQFIFDYLKNNTNLDIKKDIVIDGRFNILASNSQDIDTLIIGHTDTVPIGDGWTTNPTDSQLNDNKLYGRGVTDMKSGLAAMLLIANKLPKNTGLLFYIDEEYNFAGMKDFINRYQSKLAPKTIISLDGSELEIGNGCRGLIEIDLNIGGVSCHAATPQYGRSAINIGYQIYLGLIDYLKDFSDPVLGPTSINLGKIQGGTSPNMVPGSCRLVFDIRPSSAALRAEMIENKIKELSKLYQGSIISLKTNFDFTCWLTPKESLKLGQPFKNISASGYIDIALLWQAFNKPNCFTFGAGTQSMAHKPDEYIEIDKLEKLESILIDIIQKI